MDDQFRKASTIPRSDLLRTRARSKKKLFPFVTTFNPNLPDVGRIISKHLAILESNPKLKELFPPNSIIASFRRSKNRKELLAPSRYGPNTEREEIVEAKGCFKCKRTRCDLCRNFLVESNSFLSFQTGKSYKIQSNFLVIPRTLFIWLRARNVACNTLVLQQLTLELDFATISLLWSLRKRLVR